MSENVGGIVWTASMETQQLVNGERQVNQAARRTGRNFDKLDDKSRTLNTSMTRLAKAIAGVFAVRQLQRFTMETIAAIDEQGKFATAVGVSFENLQKLQFAAEQNGATANEFNNSLRRLARRTEEAARGTGAAVNSFEALGLNAKELIDLSPDEIFLRVADSFGKLETSGQRVSTAFGLFDTEGAKLINTLNQGREGVEALGREAERSGRVLGQQAADDAARFNDELNKLQGAAKGAAVSLGAELIPRMTDLIMSATDWLSTGNNVENLIKGIGVVAQTTAAILAGRLVASIWASIRAMQVAAIGARTLTGALALLGGPVGIIATVVTGLGLIALNTRKANAAQQDNQRTVANLAQRYEDLSDAQLRLLRLDIEQEMRDIEKATKGMTDSFGTAQGLLSGLNADELQGLGDYLGVEIDTSTQERESASIARLIERYGELEGALKQLESTYSGRRNRAGGDNEQTEESIKTITSLAERNEELRAALSGTSDELEVRRALQVAGVEAGTAEAEVIEALVRGNQGLAEAIREVAEAEQRRQELEGVAASDLGLTRLQALKQRYDEEAQLLLEAQAAGIESEVSYQERLNEIHRQYSEERKQIIADETETWKDRLNEVGFSMESMMNQGVGALASVAAGFQSGSDAARAFAQNVLTQALGALIRMALQSTILKSKEVAEATASGAAIAAAYTPAAIAANIASFGGAGAAAAASAPIAATATTAAIQMGGARQYGGPVEHGKAYRVNETEPEMFIAGGHQYLMPNMRGEVMNSKQVGGGDVNVSIRVNNNAPGVDVGVRQQGSGNNRQFILDVVKADINNYGQSTVGALSTVTNIKRKTQ